MTTVRELEERWCSPQGEQALDRLRVALRSLEPLSKYGAADRRSMAVLKEALAGLPHAAEVEPALDLRAVPMFRLYDGWSGVPLARVDLSGARLDHTELVYGPVDCRMVGTVFDGVQARNRAFLGDFAKASFVAAQLAGARFKTLRLSHADFSKARMMRAVLVAQKLEKARFTSADLRMAELARADIRGADFTDADCTECTFGEVRFDATTRVHGCRLSSAYVSPDFATHAREHGAIITEPDAFQPNEIDATIAALEERAHPACQVLIAKLREIRDRAASDARWDWRSHVLHHLPSEQALELREAFEDAVRHMEHYLS
jgi:uncharacterized protein YjbI with pentapeptide repeats